MKPSHVLLLLLLAALLAACEIQGGAPRPTSVASAPPGATAAPPAEATVAPALTSVPSPETATVAPPVAERGVRIGLLDDPGDLLPYHDDPADERLTAPITELLFPAPLLVHSYAYTTTGVLERVPSLENGDVTVSTVEVYLDSAGMITTTATAVITEVQQISVTFRWNPKLTWSDGTPVTADDSLYAYELARQVYMGQEAASKLALLDRYEKVDAHTTRAVLKPDYTDPAYPAVYWTPLPRHALLGRNLNDLREGDFARAPLSYGPYVVERRDQGSVRLARNPYYQGRAGPFENITFIFRDNPDLLRTAVAGGSLDVALLEQPLPETLRLIRADAEQGALKVSVVSSPVWEHLTLNLDVPVLQNIRVRRAIAHAINREAMVAELLGGYGAVLDSWIVPGQWAAAPPDQLTRYPYDPDAARRLLDEAGLVDANGDGLREVRGQPFVLNLVTTQNSPLRLAAARRISADLAAVGIGTSLQEVPTAGLYSADGPLFRRTFEIALFAWIAGPDPRGWERWSCAGVPSENNGWTGNNFSGWCFFEADRAIRIATTSLVQEERAAAYLRQQQLFTQEVPVLPLFQRVDVTLVAPSLAGVKADPTAPITWNSADWSRVSAAEAVRPRP
ncbi:MAG: peptide ABC transporter substrate-binding protein [Oscillochloridaceae bacterium]|nr:peptide ABC transporter substrate-binding protein [Chloroflexaceae bacterium]MDW8392166.1 peptide ABC transporter substrate-binding protein [Oscillochloridaceae bacterium]